MPSGNHRRAASPRSRPAQSWQLPTPTPPRAAEQQGPLWFEATNLVRPYLLAHEERLERQRQQLRRTLLMGAQLDTAEVY